MAGTDTGSNEESIRFWQELSPKKADVLTSILAAFNEAAMQRDQITAEQLANRGFDESIAKLHETMQQGFQLVLLTQFGFGWDVVQAALGELVNVPNHRGVRMDVIEAVLRDPEFLQELTSMMRVYLIELCNGQDQ